MRGKSKLNRTSRRPLYWRGAGYEWYTVSLQQVLDHEYRLFKNHVYKEILNSIFDMTGGHFRNSDADSRLETLWIETLSFDSCTPCTIFSAHISVLDQTGARVVP